MTNKQVVIGATIIGMFVASAAFTIYAGLDAEKNNDTDTETENVDYVDQQQQMQDIINTTKANLGQSDETSVTTETPVVKSPVYEGNPYEDLNSMIGLEEVKAEVNSLVNLVKVQKQREAQGLKNTTISYHCVFSGNPGTGKTTVARLLAAIYKDLGVVSKGHMVETDRSGLIGEYVGQTAPKTNALIDSALGGVLFIDEAYAIMDKKGGGYGDEAIATLLKRMEDDRDDLVVIVAGYTKEMKDFIDTNPGLQSRFNRYINFKDYSVDELCKIFMTRTDKYGFKLTPEADEKLHECLQEAYDHKTKNFGNGRYVRNVFEQAVTVQANRLSKLSGELTKETLSEMTAADIEQAYKSVKQ